MIEALVKLLFHTLLFLLRLIILLFTGQWVKLGQASDEAAAPNAAAPQGPSALEALFKPSAAGRGERSQLLAQVKALSAQQPEAQRAQLEHLSRTAERFYADVEGQFKDHGFALPKRKFVALSSLSEAELARLSELAERTNRVPFYVPERSLRDWSGYVRALRARVEIFAEDSQLVPRLRGQLGLPSLAALPGMLDRLPEPLVARLAFGAWLRPLLAEVLLTLRLGPGYIRLLLREAESGRYDVVLGPWGSPLPPMRLRLEAALASLALLDEFDSELAEFEHEVQAILGKTPALPIRLGDASQPSAAQLAFETWRAQLDEVLESVFDGPLPGAGGLGLLDFAAVVYDRDRAQELFEATSVNREPANSDVGDLIAAALDAQSDPILERELLRRLRERLGAPRLASERSKRGSAKKADVSAKPEAQIASLRDAVRSPQELRQAVIWGAVLGPRPTLSRPRRDKHGPR